VSRLSMLDTTGGEWLPAENFYRVKNPHTFAQAAGYLKFALRDHGPILFRGQSNIYTNMFASLHRGLTATSGFKNRERAFATYLKEARPKDAFIPNTPEYAHAAILQHYGVRTHWLDVVDNIWVALWFACHEARVIERHASFLHFLRRRRPYPDNGALEYAYVVLIQARDVTSVENSPGLWRGKEAELIDLRIAAPSVYLRPHAQHGLLVRKRNNPDLTSCDLSPLVVGILGVEIGDALDWIGSGDLLSVHTLFPPPQYDFGYLGLLSNAPLPPKSLGGIQHIGA
jgi:FRG domain